MDFRIAIPSYNREDILEKCTLGYLKECFIRPEIIDIFLSSEEQRKRYSHLAEKGYNLIVPGKDILNVRDKFNAIHNHYPIGTKVFVMEDDIDRLVFVERSKSNDVKKLLELSDFISDGFSYCIKGNANIFGIFSSANGFYMNKTVTIDFKFLVANAFGFISTRRKELECTLICKSDYERTILYYLYDGKTIRFNYVGAVTKNYHNFGGMERNGRFELERFAVDYLCNKYPLLVRENKTKNSIFPELSFRTVKKFKK